MRPIWRTLLGLAKRLMGLGALSDDQVDGLVVRQLVPTLLERSPFAGKLEVDDILARLGDAPGPRRLIDLMLRLGNFGDGFGLTPGGLTLESVAASRHGLELGQLTASLPESLRTASGRIELAPERILADLSRLDAWIEAGPAPQLSLIGRREVRSMNSWLHNLPSMVKGRERCTLEVAPADAARLGLRHGGAARVESRIASVVVPVEVSERMTPGVVSLAHGWGHDLPGVKLSVATRRPGVNANLVVDDAEVDGPSGTSVLNGVSVRVSPA
jgi:anaerobic selenocysteine-containing dehydrogenase